MIHERRQAGEERLFPKWHRQGEQTYERAAAKSKATGKPMPKNVYYSRFIPRKFNRSRATIGITDDRRDFYSFRHSFKSGLASAGVSRDISDQLTGHADRTAGSSYIHAVSVARMKEAIEHLHFDGFDLVASSP